MMMTNTSEITFNIIYIPRTVRLLRSFLHSLSDLTTEIRFRLIANHCLPFEKQILQKLCAGNDRLDFLDLATRRMQPHGVVLNTLQQSERSLYFAFMDSDCFAIADFSPYLASQLQLSDAVFSGDPIWADHLPRRLPKENKLLYCPYNELADGQFAGSSYFAVYDNRIVSECIKQTGISFLSYRWHQIPHPIQEMLETAGKRLEHYDTGKLLNIILGLKGYHCQNTEIPSLRHIGAISDSLLYSRRMRFSFYLETLRLMRPLRRFLTAIGMRDDAKLTVNNGERNQLIAIKERRVRVGNYLMSLLQALEKGAPATSLKPFRHDDKGLETGVNRIVSQIRDNHAAWLKSATKAG